MKTWTLWTEIYGIYKMIQVNWALQYKGEGNLIDAVHELTNYFNKLAIIDKVFINIYFT